MHNTIYMILNAFTMMLYPSVDRVPPILIADECAGAELSKNSDCEVLVGESCQNACFNQDLTATCEVQCGMQNCHDYECYDWRCVADCIDASVSACVSGCSGEGSLFCDSDYIVSGPDVSACVDFLCENNVVVEGEVCY